MVGRALCLQLVCMCLMLYWFLGYFWLSLWSCKISLGSSQLFHTWSQQCSQLQRPRLGLGGTRPGNRLLRYHHRTEVTPTWIHSLICFQMIALSLFHLFRDAMAVTEPSSVEHFLPLQTRSTLYPTWMLVFVLLLGRPYQERLDQPSVNSAPQCNCLHLCKRCLGTITHRVEVHRLDSCSKDAK